MPSIFSSFRRRRPSPQQLERVRKAAGVASRRFNAEPLPNRDEVLFQSSAERGIVQAVKNFFFLERKREKLLNSRAGRRGKKEKFIIHEEFASPAEARSNLEEKRDRGQIVQRFDENYEVTPSNTIAERPCRSFRTLKSVEYEPRLGRKPSFLETRTTTMAPHPDTKLPTILSTTIKRETNPLSRPQGSLNPFRNRQRAF